MPPPLLRLEGASLAAGYVDLLEEGEHRGLRVQDAAVPGRGLVIRRGQRPSALIRRALQFTSTIRRYHPTATEIAPGTFQKTIDPVQWFTQHGYTQWTSYQPATRFWPLQIIEGGWLVALSLLLIAATIWLVRRRPS